MSENNIRYLQVLPSRSADLCFGMPGVISLQNYNHASSSGPAYIGQQVTKYEPRTQLYVNFGETLTNPADPRYPGDPSARLKYDSGEIHAAITGSGSGPFLFALRNETLAAALDQAIARREGLYFERFKHGAAVQSAMTTAFPAVLNWLQELQTDGLARFNAVDAAHGASGMPPVIQESKSTTASPPTETSTKQRNVISVNGEFDSPDDKELDTRIFDELETDASKKHVQTQKSDRLTSFPYAYDSTAAASDRWQSIDEDFIAEVQVSKTKILGDQVTKTEVPSFFHPRLDNTISHKQMQAGLATEKLSQTLASLSAPHMDRIVADERAALDFEVRRLQIGYAETYLTSPITGVVTAVFKDLGDSVQAGEPVMRVENDAVVFLAGRIQYFGLLRIGQDVIVRAADLYEAGVATDFKGRIRGIRGHQADDDEWEVLIECENPTDVQGRRKLPIYYQFDRDSTKIVVP